LPHQTVATRAQENGAAAAALKMPEACRRLRLSWIPLMNYWQMLQTLSKATLR